MGVDSRRPPSSLAPSSLEFRILAIDGGGIRGLIPAVFLARLEELLAAALAAASGDVGARWTGIEAPRIADCFHLIAGTSTGGLLAAGLTRPGPDGRALLPASAAAQIYRTYGSEIFARPLLRNVIDHFDLVWPKYPLDQLRKVLTRDDVLGDALLKDAVTDVLVLSYDISLPGPAYFTRWGSRDDPGPSMVDAALATAAAPTFFNAAKLADGKYVDGGVYAGNPSLAAIGMALRRTQAPVVRDPRELLMVSLGTGAYTSSLDIGYGGIVGWLSPLTGEPLIEAMLGGGGEFADEVAHMLLNGAAPPGTEWDPKLPRDALGGGPQLWRYQPPLPGNYALDDVSQLAALEQVAAKQIKLYAAEMEMLAHRLIAAGPVTAAPAANMSS